MTTQHTPTPWQAPETISFYILGASELGQFVANASTKANADFIVRACNAHDELVAALSQIARLASEGEVSANMQYALGDIARAALAKIDKGAA